MNKCDQYSHGIIAFALFTTLLPVAPEYLASFLMLVWLVACHRDQIVMPKFFGFKDTTLPHHLRFYQLMLNILLATVILSLIALVGRTAFGGGGADFWREAWKLVHVSLKMALVPFVIFNAFFIYFHKHKSFEKPLKWFSVYLVIYLTYYLAQRWTGIDWAHGFGKILPSNRFAYGVFRPSGFIGHPLTFSYNVLNLTLLFTSALLLRKFSFLGKVQTKFIAAILGSLFIMLFLSGSRWPIAVFFLVVMSGFLGWFFKNWKWTLVIAILGLVGLYIEGSMLGRMGELFSEGVHLRDKFARVVFWQAHWEMIKDHFMWGVGIAGGKESIEPYYLALNYHDKIYNAHNIYLQMTADSGVWGGMSVVLICFAPLIWFVKKPMGGNEKIARSLFVGLCLSGLMQNVLKDSEFLYSFWISVSLALIFWIDKDVDERWQNKNSEPRSDQKDSD